MSQEVEMTSVAIEPLSVYPQNCESMYDKNLCAQLQNMQQLANSLNANVSALVQDYEEAVQEFDRVSEKLVKARETGTTTTTAMKALVTERNNLQIEKKRLEDRLQLLQDRTLPAVNTYMGKVNEVIGKKRKLAPGLAEKGVEEEEDVEMEEEVGELSPEEKKLAARKILSAMLKFPFAKKAISYKETLKDSLGLFNITTDTDKTYQSLIDELKKEPRIMQILGGIDVEVDRQKMDNLVALPTFERQLDEGLILDRQEFDPAQGRAVGAV